jgi:hypothetical protein
VKIKFLRDCEAPQEWQEPCETCGSHLMPSETTHFFEGQEINPYELWEQIDLRKLKYKVDYEITEYP